MLKLTDYLLEWIKSQSVVSFCYWDEQRDLMSDDITDCSITPWWWTAVWTPPPQQSEDSKLLSNYIFISLMEAKRSFLLINLAAVICDHKTGWNDVTDSWSYMFSSGYSSSTSGSLLQRLIYWGHGLIHPCHILRLLLHEFPITLNTDSQNRFFMSSPTY